MRGYLLDTQIWLWANTDDARLSEHSWAILRNPQNALYLSVAAMWEIVIKHAIGKLELPELPSRYIPKRLVATGTRSLAVQQSHVLEVAHLPLHHRDPFDRLLVAQARADHMMLLTADEQLSRYDCPLQMN